jgi:hypothetical protein
LAETDNHAATLAAALSSRVGVLADAARDTMTAIERDRSALEGRYGSSVMADELIEAVSGRLDGVADDCRDLAAILDRFRSLAGPTDVSEAPSALPTTPEPLPTAPIGGPLPPVPGVAAPEEHGPHLSDGVRLLATQMSVAGASPDEIALRLREDFGVPDADRLVRELFGLPELDEVTEVDEFEEEYDVPEGNDELPQRSEGPPGLT